MKKYLKNFNLDFWFVKDAVYNCLSKQRWKRRDTQVMFAEFFVKKNNLPKEQIHDKAIEFRTMAYMNKEDLYPIADDLCNQLLHEIKTRQIKLKPICYQQRIDGSQGKLRTIGISSMKQQCFDYIAVTALLPMFNAKIGTYQCASIPKRGQIYGVHAIEKWVRSNPKECKHIVKCDVRKYYPQVNKDKLLSLLKRDVADKDILYLVETLVSTYDQGLCIGQYLSQYLANYYLSYAYHYMDDHCYKIRRNKRVNLLSHKLLYMDDVFMCGSSKRDVLLAFNMMRKYLKEELFLDIKDGYKIFELDKQPIDMMGFKIYTYKTVIRKRIFERLNRKFNKYKSPFNDLDYHEAYSVISYYGFIKHSYSKNYANKMKVKRVICKAKECINR